MTARIAVVGCGAAARRIHLPGFRVAGAEVPVFASRSQGAAEAAAAEWGSGDTTTDWREAVTRDDVDGVAVCTPNALHAEMAIVAARAGKHVLVEKPMATTVAEADAMIEAAAGAGVHLVPAHNARFAPPVVAVRDAVEAGRLGRVTGFRVAVGHSGPRSWAPGASWFFDPGQSGGGALMDLGIHAADIVHAVIGDLIAEVAALVDAEPIEESANVVARTRGGALGTLAVSWRAIPGPDQHLTLFGTAGTLHFSAPGTLTIRTADDESEVPLEVPEATAEPYSGFVRAIEGDHPPVTAADGRAAVAVVEAAYRSARSGTLERVEA
jgi:predicted dehydrogenase